MNVNVIENTLQFSDNYVRIFRLTDDVIAGGVFTRVYNAIHCVNSPREISILPSGIRRNHSISN